MRSIRTTRPSLRPSVGRYPPEPSTRRPQRWPLHDTPSKGSRETKKMPPVQSPLAAVPSRRRIRTPACPPPLSETALSEELRNAGISPQRTSAQLHRRARHASYARYGDEAHDQPVPPPAPGSGDRVHADPSGPGGLPGSTGRDVHHDIGARDLLEARARSRAPEPCQNVIGWLFCSEMM